MAGDLVTFLGISALVIVTPGPDTALTIRSTVLAGRGGGIFTALGVVTGQALWALAASLGVAALLVASDPAFEALKLLGAAYLALLGVQSLRAALRRNDPSATIAADADARRRLRPLVAYRQGVISNLGNPKMAVFFTSLLPQFTGDSGSTFAASLLLGLVFCTLTFAWLAAYATVVDKVGDFMRRPRVRRSLDGLVGGVLVALGVRLASEQR